MAIDGLFNSIKGPASRIFQGLYGAPADPRLGEGAGRNALAQGLQQGGLAMMMAGGQPNQDFLSLLAQGMMASKAGAAQFQQNQLAVQNQMELAELAKGPVTPDNLGRMMMTAIGAGNIEAARTLSEVLKSQMAGGRASQRPQYITRTENGKRYRIAVDPYTMEEISRTEIDFPTSAFQRYSSVPLPDDEQTYTDDTGTYLRNNLTGQWERIHANTSRPRSDAEGRAQSFVEALQLNIPIVEEFVENPLPLEGEMYRNWLAGNLSSDRARRLYGAAIPIGEAWLRQTTGAAYNDTEYANSALIFIPRAGDSPEVRQQKSEMMRVLMLMTKRRAGLPLSPQERDFQARIANRYERHLARTAHAYAGAIDRGASSEEAIEEAQRSMGWGNDEGGGGILSPEEWARRRAQGDTVR